MGRATARAETAQAAFQAGWRWRRGTAGTASSATVAATTRARATTSPQQYRAPDSECREAAESEHLALVLGRHIQLLKGGAGGCSGVPPPPIDPTALFLITARLVVIAFMSLPYAELGEATIG